MNRIIQLFGKTVSDSVAASPKRALKLLRAGYRASSLQMKLMPDQRLLPHQKYVARLSNRAIREPLRHPERSAIVNLFFPCEFLHALDIAPLFTEGLAGYINGAGSEQVFVRYAEDAGIPQTYCSYHKILLGAALSDVLPPPRFVANTSLACDANMGTFRSIAAHYMVPHFVVDVPNSYTDETIGYVARQLRGLVPMLEETTGKKLKEERLKAIIRRGNRSLAMYKEHFRLLSEKYMPGDLSSEMLRLFPTHILFGTREAERYFRILLGDTRSAPPSRGEKRILWVHAIPFWQDSMRKMLNFSERRQLLACDLNFDSLRELDENRPYESMARRLLLNILNGPEENREGKLLEMARALRADGVVYFCHWGCKQTMGSARLIRERLEREGFPVLVLDGDGCDRNNVNDGQMSTRLQAFLELLEDGS